MATYGFPFFGAGEATYFEWAAVEVVFQEEPDPKQKKLIEEKVPSPLGDIDWEGRFLSASSGQAAHAGIASTYRTQDGLDPDEMKNWDDDRWFFAADSQVEAFNADIERWLHEIHGVSPLLFALRSEDYESDGTEFSDWHTHSLKTLGSVLPFFDSVVSDFDYDSRRAIALSALFEMIEDVPASVLGFELAPKYVTYRAPGKIEFEAFEKGDVGPLVAISNPNYADKAIQTFIERLCTEHSDAVEKHVNVFLDFESRVDESTFEELMQVLFASLSDVESEVFAQVASHITDVDFVDSVAADGFRLMVDGKHKESIALFIKALSAPVDARVRTGLYTNVLWVLQKDNTGLPVDKKANHLALEKCIQKGESAPAIFFNACCIYSEMEEYEKAYEMVSEAIAQHYDKESMYKEIKSESMFKGFRDKTDVLSLLENSEPEPKENPEARIISESVGYNRFNIHDIYNRGYAVHFEQIVLVNGDVKVDGEFNDTFSGLIDSDGSRDELALVIVNGNLSASSIGECESVHLLVMGRIDCDNIRNSEIIEKRNTNFDYVPQKLKKYNER